jgi:hypothetical protein
MDREGASASNFEFFDTGRTDVQFMRCVFEIQNFVYGFDTSKVVDFLRCYIFVG